MIVECELEECVHCGEQLVPSETWHMRKAVQTMEGRLFVAGKSKKCDCADCSHYGHHYHASGVLRVSLPHSTYGLDVLAFIGWQHEHEHKQLVEIQEMLNEGGIEVCERHVGRLYRQFLALLGGMNERVKFFTQMVRIADLVQVPAVTDAIASQYSGGCFATWDPTLVALIATVTGSARPVDKGSITDDDLVVIVGVRPDGNGALIRHVEGKRNDPPSSEAVEMMDMDSPLPTITLGPAWHVTAQVPVARSKLHGHRGVAVYDPRWMDAGYLQVENLIPQGTMQYVRGLDGRMVLQTA